MAPVFQHSSQRRDARSAAVKLIPDHIGKATVWSFPPFGQKPHSCADGLMSRACTWKVELDIGFVILRELACLVAIKSSKHGGVRGHFVQWPHRVPSGTVEKLVRFNQTRVYPRHFNECRIKRLIWNFKKNKPFSVSSVSLSKCGTDI